MIGITSWGAYIPRYRLNRKTIFAAMGWFNPATAGIAKGEKAVANYDEDSITMAVAASIDCLNGTPREKIGGFYLCSTSFPYVIRLNASICAAALGFGQDTRTADFGASTRSGTTALISACEAVKAGEVEHFLVCATDSRVAKPGSSMEYTFGDGAAAIIVGSDNVVAEFKGSYSIARDFPDYRQIQEEKFFHVWEERWIRDEGYSKIIPKAALGLAEKYNLQISDFAKIIIPCPDAAALRGITKRLGIAPEQIQDNMMANVGDTGTAMPLMMLAAALEDAKPKDKILVISYGGGGDALYFEVTEDIRSAKTGKGVKGHLESKKELGNYQKYLVYRDLLPVDVGIRGEEIAMARPSVMYREGKTLATLCGSRCKVCGTPQYPKQRVCINPECGAIDQMEDYYFYDKIGRITSFTGDRLAFSYDPPAMYGLIDFEEGGRLYLDITDAELSQLKVGLPVRMTFRRKIIDKKRGMFAYFWKATPVEQ